MRLHRRSISVPLSTGPAQITWDYYPLADIQILMGEHGSYARLILEHDEGGEMFTALCPEREFPSLEPYAALLSAWRHDHLGHEKPVVPIDYNRNGEARFSRAGSRNDFPEHHRATSQTLRRVGLNRQLVVQFRNVSDSHPYLGGVSSPRGRKQSTALG